MVFRLREKAMFMDASTTSGQQVQPFPLSFEPAAEAVRVLAEVANGAAGQLIQERAAAALTVWRNSLATPAQIEAVYTDDELEVDDEGACVSAGDDGFFVQTWSWVSYGDRPELTGEDEDDGEAGSQAAP